MKLLDFAKKVKNKGIIKSFSIFFNAYIFSHWKMYLLERPLELESIKIKNDLTPALVTEDNLYIFEKNFSSYVPAIKKLLAEGSRPEVYTDENNDAYVMFWIHEGGDYYDKLLYKCRIPIPKDSIYQFAGEVAKDKRGGRMTVYAQQHIWNEYYKKGFKSTRALVNEKNAPALKMHFKLQFKETGQLIHIYKLFSILTFAKYENYSGTKINFNKELKG